MYIESDLIWYCKRRVIMSPAVKTLIILAVVAVFFITEIIPLAVTSMGGAIACGLVGVIPVKTVFSGLSNSTVVLFAGMFVIIIILCTMATLLYTIV